jgi:RNA-directed DNA polymerase
MKRLRDKIRVPTDSSRMGNGHPRGDRGPEPDAARLGNYFRIGNAATKFRQVHDHVEWRLIRLLVKKRGRNLSARHAGQWDRHWLYGMGPYKLSGTIRYPKTA